MGPDGWRGGFSVMNDGRNPGKTPSLGGDLQGKFLTTKGTKFTKRHLRVSVAVFPKARLAETYPGSPKLEVLFTTERASPQS